MVAEDISAPVDPLKFDFGANFKPAPERLRGDREDRIARGERALRYHHPYLDDQLRALAPHDLVVIGAESGAGKTQLVTGIAQNLAKSGKRVYVFALEAEDREIERRIKYSIMSSLAQALPEDLRDELTYPDWLLGRCEHIVGQFEDAADREIAVDYRTLHTYYRGARFGTDEIKRLFLAVQSQADLIILDHLHYVDIDDDNENRGFKSTMKLLRDLSIAIGKPIIIVVHLRKRETRNRRLVPTIEDVHGSSDIAKICTHQIMIAPSWSDGHVQKWHSQPTLFEVSKDRVGGRQRYVALCQFDRRTRTYWTSYTLGRLSSDGTKWKQLEITDGLPKWAKHHARIPDET